MDVEYICEWNDTVNYSCLWRIVKYIFPDKMLWEFDKGFREMGASIGTNGCILRYSAGDTFFFGLFTSVFSSSSEINDIGMIT